MAVRNGKPYSAPKRTTKKSGVKKNKTSKI